MFLSENDGGVLAAISCLDRGMREGEYSHGSQRFPLVRRRSGACACAHGDAPGGPVARVMGAVVVAVRRGLLAASNSRGNP